MVQSGKETLLHFLVGHTTPKPTLPPHLPPRGEKSPPCEFGQGGVIQDGRQVNQTLHRHLFGGIQAHGHLLVTPQKRGLKDSGVYPQNDRF